MIYIRIELAGNMSPVWLRLLHSRSWQGVAVGKWIVVIVVDPRSLPRGGSRWWWWL